MGNLFADQYSLLHYAVGIITYFFNIDFSMLIILHILFEIIENMPWMINIINKNITIWPGGKPSADSILNSIGDTLFVGLGWLTAQSLDNFGTKNGWYVAHLIKV